MGPTIRFAEIPLKIVFDRMAIGANMFRMDTYRFSFPEIISPETTTAAIIGGGPTLNDDVGGMTRLQQLDQSLGLLKVLAGSAHRLVDQKKLEYGANITVINSPDPAFADVFAKPHEGMTYWLPTFADPAVVEKLKGGEIRVWEAYVSEINYDGYSKQLVIGSGSTAPSAAAALLIHLGVKKLEFFGVDGGSFEPSINEYKAYDLSDVLARIPQADLDAHVVVEIGGNLMKVATNFWNQAEEMAYLIAKNPDVKFTFHGNSLNNMLFNQNLPYKLIHDPRQAAEKTAVPPAPQLGMS